MPCHTCTSHVYVVGSGLRQLVGSLMQLWAQSEEWQAHLRPGRRADSTRALLLWEEGVLKSQFQRTRSSQAGEGRGERRQDDRGRGLRPSPYQTPKAGPKLPRASRAAGKTRDFWRASAWPATPLPTWNQHPRSPGRASQSCWEDTRDPQALQPTSPSSALPGTVKRRLNTVGKSHRDFLRRASLRRHVYWSKQRRLPECSGFIPARRRAGRNPRVRRLGRCCSQPRPGSLGVNGYWRKWSLNCYTGLASVTGTK